MNNNDNTIDGTKIVQCPSCDGYGWFEDEFSGEATDCDWCHGTGYIYRENGVDRPIPEADYGKVSAILENLETRRLQEMGYSGTAKHPDEQEIRNREDEDLSG